MPWFRKPFRLVESTLLDFLECEMTKHTRNDVVYSIAKLNSLVIVPMSLLPWQEESSEALHPFDTARARQLYHAVSCCIMLYGGFRKWEYPLPPNHPKLIIVNGKTNGSGYLYFRKPPFFAAFVSIKFQHIPTISDVMIKLAQVDSYQTVPPWFLGVESLHWLSTWSLSAQYWQLWLCYWGWSFCRCPLHLCQDRQWCCAIRRGKLALEWGLSQASR